MPLPSTLPPTLTPERARAKLERLYKLRELERAKEAAKRAKWHAFADDPVGWLDARLGEFAWSKQRTVMESVRDHRRTVVRACHGVGKSFIASRIIAWWLDTHPPGEAFVLSTAPTFHQVRAILWREVGKAHGKVAARAAEASEEGLPGRIVGGTEWKIGAELVGMGRKPADTNEHAFQGIHAPAVLIVIDEACGVTEQLWTAAKAIATNDNCRILAIGNPDDPASEMAKACKPASGWNVVHIDALESPNLSRGALEESAENLGISDKVLDAVLKQMPEGWDGEQVPTAVEPQLTSAGWVLESARDWGVDSPLWSSKVRGEFPDLSDDALIPWNWIAKALHRDLTPSDGDPNELGIDVARFGSDRSVFVHRHGPRVRVIADYTKQDTMTTAGQVVRHLRETGAEKAKVDAVGVGAGVVDRLRELDVPAYEVQASWKAQDSDRFADARSEWYWQLRQMFENSAIDIDDDELAAQLGRMKFTVTSKGQIRVLGKEDMKKAGFGSPDRADAATYAIAKTAPTPDVLLI